MCNLYDVGPPPKLMDFPWEASVAELVAGLTYVAPGREGVVVTARGGRIAAARMSWGFPRTFSSKGKAVARAVNNARDDKLTGRMWADAFAHRRCLIPVLRFYEWSGSPGRKTKHAIRKGGGDRWFWIAGIWEEPVPGTAGASYSMITTPAGPAMAALHDRMPLVLPDGSVTGFLEDPALAASLVRPSEEPLHIDPPVAGW